MTTLRWVMGVLAAVLCAGSLIGLAMFIAADDERWIKLARRLRQWAFTLLLFWFNLEIWGRVGYTLIHWNG